MEDPLPSTRKQRGIGSNQAAETGFPDERSKNGD
jgi:hypothetical protein